MSSSQCRLSLYTRLPPGTPSHLCPSGTRTICLNIRQHCWGDTHQFSSFLKSAQTYYQYIDVCPRFHALNLLLLYIFLKSKARTDTSLTSVSISITTIKKSKTRDTPYWCPMMEQAMHEKWSYISRQRVGGKTRCSGIIWMWLSTWGERHPLYYVHLLSYSVQQSAGLECGHAWWYAWPTTSAACLWMAVGTTGQQKPLHVTMGPAWARWSGLLGAGVRWVARTGCVCLSLEEAR